MCIIADSVESVSKTKIACVSVAHSYDNGKTIIYGQLIVYSANINSITESNAIILPIFNPGNDINKIIPLDLSLCTDFFEEIDKLFMSMNPYKNSSNEFRSLSYSSHDYLPVHSVGDYKFSIMSSKIDFNRLDRSQLNIHPTSKKSIDMHNDNYSFIVFQFYKRGNIDISPFGYIKINEDNDKLFVPTIHGHPDTIAHNYNSKYSSLSYNEADFDNMANYDHTIYSFVRNTNPDMIDNSYSLPVIVKLNNIFKKITKDYLNQKIKIYVPKLAIMRKNKLDGNYQNRNIIVDCDGYNFLNDLIVDKK